MMEKAGSVAEASTWMQEAVPSAMALAEAKKESVTVTDFVGRSCVLLDGPRSSPSLAARRQLHGR